LIDSGIPPEDKMNFPSAAKSIAALQRIEPQINADWLKGLKTSGNHRPDLIKDDDLSRQSQSFLATFLHTMQMSPSDDVTSEGWAELRGMLEEMSTSRAQQGFTPSETASFVLSLKPPLFKALEDQSKGDAKVLSEALWGATHILDQLGLYTTEAYQKTREQVIIRQQRDLMELSTPVVQLWDDILALPLVGTLDSSRAQVVMETLLQKIVETEASIAIIDITGVPTVDTLVAQHLMKTIAATRLMGADCIISGIRPQIAQTIVHLGVNLGEVITKATLADAFAVALKRTGARVVPIAQA
jgi:rsbT co-antagonist protein RsbR